MTSQTDSTKAAVLEMLRSGECTVMEAARLARVDRQLVDYWAKRAGLAVMELREARLARLFKRTRSAIPAPRETKMEA